jgi:purine-cytosine permease-like protein
MVQFYFLSILMNLIGGLSLALSATRSRGPALDGLVAFLRDRTVCLVAGILCAVTGAFKLLTVIRGDIPVIGDFVPALAGIAVGATLMLEHFREAPPPSAAEPARKARAAPEGEAGARASSEQARGASGFELFFLERKVAVGLAGIIAGAVHFLFPMVLFL